ncbi:hypothetical protein ACHAXA_000617 [Cyclostephanos tholiformis]|uniref:Uncharacterized protein n=1 Tax=Cyclostephanos tholiformis TaxID=382380 RepID=A0ABD3SQA6_9STRA
MALRVGGTYLLAGTALRSQSRVAYHLSKMEIAASDSIALSAALDAELASSVILGSESAIDSENGLTLQDEAAELELDAELEYLSSEVEYVAGDAYEAEAEELRDAAGGDALESEASFAESERATVESARLRSRAEMEGESAAQVLEASTASWEGSLEGVKVAAIAEERAIEDGALATADAASGLSDGKVLAKAETSAMEDAEVMAACAPMPVLNLMCEAIGSVVEIGYQSIAALEGAKAAVESISATIARGEERAELALAAEEREDAARLAVEAERLRIEADDESAVAVADEYRAELMAVEAGEEEALGEEKLEESEREVALAVVLEEKASEQYVKAAQDEGIAIKEEESAIATQVESEGLLSKSTSEEFESLAERTDAISKDAKVEDLLRQSVGYGIHALGFAVHAIVTAGLVVYVVVIGGLINTGVPAAKRIWNREHRLSALYVIERICDILIHLGVAFGCIASKPNLLSNFEGISAPLKIRALFHWAAVAGVIESVVNFVFVGSTIVSICLAFFSNFIHSVPQYMIELLIVWVLFGPGVFDNIVHMKPVSIWGILMLLKCISSWAAIFNAASTKHTQSRRHIDEGECNMLCASDGRSKEMFALSNVTLRYGSVETDEIDNVVKQINCSSSTRTSISVPDNFVVRCRKTLFGYCEGLRLLSDLLLLSLMVALLRHCWPLIEVLHPVAETFLGTFNAWMSLPILIGVTVVLLLVVHFLFVH